MIHTRWLLVLGILLGSLLLTGFAFWMQPMLLNSSGDAIQAHLADDSSLQGCRENQSIKGSVRQWCDVIVQQANDHQLDPLFIAAVITVESGGDADALSGSGAVGLMQVMPRDGIASQFQCVNGPCFANRPSMAELYDPAFNIQYGSNLLAGLLSRYQGDTREALKSYGPHDSGYGYADMVLGVYQMFQQ